MVFNREIVEQYLAIVDDENPIHEYIVPGQLIVEKVFSIMDDQWDSYKIKYVQTTDINETIDFEVVENERIIVSNKANGVKLVIIRN
ncbi:hypothetical protein [Staphylococcus haemolyticus]|uniref:hypothetical protein n=1 Tax=Staphylococcus haemolyticus TaxID=1283 RepID=UPI00288868D7|nr:hypothetical protein [Staphylococcus haemolyticus]MDT0724312.1 hypothetical protein [Staphylococcus haemolyticus]MDU0423163.1 hypothetical protein [Staphylococcus haemolyticus]MDU0439947.1 hypothetical protein [Staphylococcus haemolyticus]MDU0442270.1 hypothetical protein [Staphylococcus haemolyticus]MDU0445087.1 hypothetical protein [Staphylococcus haemolyticus]